MSYRSARLSRYLPIDHLSMADKADRRARFLFVYAKIADDLWTSFARKIPQEAMDWYRRVRPGCGEKRKERLMICQSLDYNVPRGGKLNCGMSVIDTVEILKRRPLSEEEYLKAAVLGW